MRPREKAIELIEKLKPYVDYTECDVFNERQNMLKNAKNCATILVDEIINHKEILGDDFTYWDSVKLEIEIYRE